MESKIVAEFMQKTGCEIEVAYTFLQTKRWDLSAALEEFQFLQDQSTVNGEDNVNLDSFNLNVNKSAREPLQIPNSGYVPEGKKLTRGISRATDNVPIVIRARSAIAQDFADNPYFKIDRYYFETPEFTFTLPDLTIYGTEFKDFLEKDIIEKSALSSLEQAGRLNWWAEYGFCQKLWPLSTSGDGNCLLHAASLAMWGFHDRLLTLRKALHVFLKDSSCRHPIYRRWRWQQTRTNAQSGFVYSEMEWQCEWEIIVNMASTEPRREKNGRRFSNTAFMMENENATYESLEEIHVLALAHILKRPIIVIADLMLKDMNGEPIAPIPFGGIYLPFEIPVSECHHSPLLLTYDMAHFSALVVMDKENNGDKIIGSTIPLVDSNNCLLPLLFNVDPGETFNWQTAEEQEVINNLVLTEKNHILLLRKYLDVVEITASGTASEDEGGAFSEDEIEKKFSEIRESSDEVFDSNIFSNNKNRAAKQLQSVAKQFGSIGKSMSRKLKKNFTKITNNSSKSSKPSNDSVNDTIFSYRGAKVLCCHLHMKRHEYQNEMVYNYLQFAQTRFLNEIHAKLRSEAILESPTKCVNTDCNNFGTAITSYMCQKCFDQQCKEELKCPIEARYGTGKSKFYRDCDVEYHNNLALSSTIKRPSNNSNHTLYLSKSTFYNDTGTSFVNTITSPIESNSPKITKSHNSQPLDSSYKNNFEKDQTLVEKRNIKDQPEKQNYEEKYFSYNMNVTHNPSTKLNKQVKRQVSNVCFI